MLSVFNFDILTDLYKELVTFVPNIAAALVILLVTLILVSILARVLRKMVKRIGLDEFADKSINKIEVLASNNIRILPSVLLSKTLYYFLLLIGIVAATDALQMEAVSDLVRSAVDYVPLLITAVVLLIVGLLIADFVQDVTLAAMKSLNIPAAKFIASFIFYFIMLSVLMIALEQAKINTDFLTANISILLGGVVLAFAIGYGFASQNLMASYIAYFYNKNKVAIGDKIRINGQEGTVTYMDSTNITIVPDQSNNRILIPMSHLSTETVEIIAES
ncbi:MAG: mechanosensitive ion channel domain-containing protein [Bacteroidota bacterium]